VGLGQFCYESQSAGGMVLDIPRVIKMVYLCVMKTPKYTEEVYAAAPRPTRDDAARTVDSDATPPGVPARIDPVRAPDSRRVKAGKLSFRRIAECGWTSAGDQQPFCGYEAAWKGWPGRGLARHLRRGQGAPRLLEPLPMPDTSFAIFAEARAWRQGLRGGGRAGGGQEDVRQRHACDCRRPEEGGTETRPSHAAADGECGDSDGDGGDGGGGADSHRSNCWTSSHTPTAIPWWGSTWTPTAPPSCSLR
jgi:hypothetical protein